MSINVVHSVAEYLSTVRAIRKGWKTPKHQELWFRAEDERHRETRLQPGIYRPNENSGKRKSVRYLLELENDLYEEFGRCSAQLSDVKSNQDDWEWDSFFLMQHHGVPTRLLDWSDGALIALHFAVRDKPIPPKTGSIIYVLDPYWLVHYLDEHANRKDAKARWRKFWEKHQNDVSEDDWDRLYLPSDEDDFKESALGDSTDSPPMGCTSRDTQSRSPAEPIYDLRH